MATNRKSNSSKIQKNLNNSRSGKKKTFNKKSNFKDSNSTPTFSGFTRPTNAFAWYDRNPELLAATSRIPFANRPGMFVDTGDAPLNFDMEDFVPTIQGVPGFMRIEYAYSVGYSNSPESAASRCAQQMYKVIRQRYSGALDADAPDLLLYAIAIEQVHAYIAWLKRLYRTINAYTPDNHMYPTQALRAQIAQAGSGVTDERLRKLTIDKVKFYGAINTLVNMINKFELPMDMSLYERHRWMNEFIYSDTDSVRGQMYVFCPTGFFKMDDTFETGTRLVFEPLHANTINWDNPVEYLFNYGLNLINVICESEDAYTINGYIARAYEGIPTYRSALMAQDEIIAPVYVPEVLPQIHNLTVVDDFVQDSITQNPENRNAIIYEPVGTVCVGAQGVLLDMDGIAPSGEEITIATRLSTAVVGTPGEEDYHLACGTEVVTGLYITAPNTIIGGGTSKAWQWMSIGDLYVTGFLNAAAIMYGDLVRACKATNYLGAWHKAPRLLIRFCLKNDPTATPNRVDSAFTGELENIAIISAKELEDLHRVCLYSEFNAFDR